MYWGQWSVVEIAPMHEIEEDDYEDEEECCDEPSYCCENSPCGRCMDCLGMSDRDFM